MQQLPIRRAAGLLGGPPDGEVCGAMRSSSEGNHIPTPNMHRSLSSLDLEFPVSLPRMTPRVMLDEDFCLPVSDRSAPLSSLMPAPSAGDSKPIVLHPLDEDAPRRDRPYPSRRTRQQPLPFVPLQPETFTAKNPWGVHSVADMIRLFLPE